MGLQPVFALMHLGAQGHSIVYTALHLFPQDGGCLGRLGLRRFHDELIVDGQDEAPWMGVLRAIRSPLARMFRLELLSSGRARRRPNRVET